MAWMLTAVVQGTCSSFRSPRVGGYPKTFTLFNGSPDGLYPNGPPAIDSEGKVYGTTTNGGSKNSWNGLEADPVKTGKRVKEPTRKGSYIPSQGRKPAKIRAGG